MCLQGSYQSVANLVIGNNLLLLRGHDGILLLIAGKDDFNAFFHIRLGDSITVLTDSSQSCFIDDVGKLSTGSTGCHSGNRVVVDIRITLDLLGMNFEDFLTSLEIRKLYRYTAVETARTQQGRIQRFRTVGRSQDDNTCVGFEAIHFG